MKTRLAVFMLVVASVALTASAPASASSAANGPPTMTLNFLDITTSSAEPISINPRPKFGDRFYFRDAIYKWNGEKRGALAGHVDGVSTFLAGSVGQTEAVGSISGGTLEVFGAVSFNRPTSVLAVTGGTGIYAAARGEVIVRTLGGPNSNKSAVTIRLWM